MYADSNARMSLAKTRRRELLTFCALYRLEVVARQKLSNRILSNFNCQFAVSFDANSVTKLSHRVDALQS